MTNGRVRWPKSLVRSESSVVETLEMLISVITIQCGSYNDLAQLGRRADRYSGCIDPKISRNASVQG